MSLSSSRPRRWQNSASDVHRQTFPSTGMRPARLRLLAVGKATNSTTHAATRTPRTPRGDHHSPTTRCDAPRTNRVTRGTSIPKSRNSGAMPFTRRNDTSTKSSQRGDDREDRIRQAQPGLPAQLGADVVIIDVPPEHLPQRARPHADQHQAAEMPGETPPLRLDRGLQRHPRLQHPRQRDEHPPQRAGREFLAQRPETLGHRQARPGEARDPLGQPSGLMTREPPVRRSLRPMRRGSAASPSCVSADSRGSGMGECAPSAPFKRRAPRAGPSGGRITSRRRAAWPAPRWRPSAGRARTSRSTRLDARPGSGSSARRA